MEQQVLKNLKTSFTSAFKVEPLVIFSPGRINFIGEHTDYNDGYVFPAAIDKGIYLALAASKNNTSMIRALDMDASYEFDISKLHKASGAAWQHYFLGIISELAHKGIHLQQVNVVFCGTIPIGSGMSSSAALENAFVYGLNALFDLGLSKEEMIFISQAAEHHYVGVKCGIMDQYASMFGKRDAAILLDCQTLESEVLFLQLPEIALVLINTNVKHKLSDSAYNKRREACERVAAHFQVASLRHLEQSDLETSKTDLDTDDYEKASYVLEENKRVLAFKEAVLRANYNEMGALMYQSHEGLRHKYEVSCKELDFLVDYGKDLNYVLGSRMMGGGFGGCTINLIRTERLAEFKRAVSNAYFEEFNRTCDFINVSLSDGTKRLQ
jgi:galactokinase